MAEPDALSPAMHAESPNMVVDSNADTAADTEKASSVAETRTAVVPRPPMSTARKLVVTAVLCLMTLALTFNSTAYVRAAQRQALAPS